MSRSAETARRRAKLKAEQRCVDCAKPMTTSDYTRCVACRVRTIGYKRKSLNNPKPIAKPITVAPVPKALVEQATCRESWWMHAKTRAEFDALQAERQQVMPFSKFGALHSLTYAPNEGE